MTEPVGQNAQAQPVRKTRIWELDAFRGLCIFFVFASHLVFDLQAFLGMTLNIGTLFRFLFNYGGVVFILISGISATLGSRSFRRGLIVFGCGMLITLVTMVMIRLNLLDRADLIQFGVLHLLGFCMMIYPFLKKLPTLFLAIFGAVVIALGYYFATFYLTPSADPSAFDPRSFLFVLGLRLPDFCAGDYFPVFPHLGWFMEGIVLGRIVYRNRQTLFPRFPADFWLVRFFRFAGRHSLELYLLHQPVIVGILQLILLLRK